MLKRFYPRVEKLLLETQKTLLLETQKTLLLETQKTLRLQLWRHRWQNGNQPRLFSFVGKDESRRGPGLANKVDGSKFKSAIVNSCHGKPRRCELVHCLGGRGFLLWAFLAFFLWLLPLDTSVVQNNGVQSLCGPFEGVQSVWYPGNLVVLILKTFHTPLVVIEQIIEFELKGPDSTGRTRNPKTSYFDNKTKISMKNTSSSELLLTVKYTAECNVPCFPLPGPRQLQNLSKKRLWLNVNCKQKGGLNNLMFSIDFKS